jgi:hypothetical protein
MSALATTKIDQQKTIIRRLVQHFSVLSNALLYSSHLEKKIFMDTICKFLDNKIISCSKNY